MNYPFCSTWLLKQTPEHFRVREVLVPNENSSHSRPSFTLIQLRKRGITTIDAVKHLAVLSGLDFREFGWSGLKDEDAVTEQTLSLRGMFDQQQIQLWSTQLGLGIYEQSGLGRPELMLTHGGYADESLRPGHLLGNAFTVTVGGLSEFAAEALNRLHKCEFTCLNYYDVQRFGRPCEPKINHKIGLAHQQGKIEEVEALWKKKIGRDYSTSGDKISVAELELCRNAYESFLWNTSASNILLSAGVFCSSCDQEGIQYFYMAPNNFRHVFKGFESLPIVRHSNKDGAWCTSIGERSVFVSTTLYVGHINKCASSQQYSAMVSFFLGSGSYATTLIKQLEFRVECESRLL